MLTVLSVIGTRPEAIKMAPVIRQLRVQKKHVRSIVCLSGQHREMLDQAMSVFDIRADYDLAVMQPNQSLSGVTAAILEGLSPVIQKCRPDWVLAQGDTTTVLAAALSAYYNRCSFGHIEAGLRTDDRNNPFPEEMNRRLADTLADRLYAPTQSCVQQLLREGISDDHILVTGNTVIDALYFTARQAYDWCSGPLATVPREKRLVLVTAHRRESHGKPLENICRAIRDLSSMLAEMNVHFVFPVHTNPNVQQTVKAILGNQPCVSLVEPLDYLALVHLMKNSELILTDSGGIQEEAPSLGIPLLVLRDKTERPEGVEAGVARLVGTDRSTIVRATLDLLMNAKSYQTMAKRTNPYGDGKSGREDCQQSDE